MKELMNKVGCVKYPEAWDRYYETALKESKRDDYPYIQPEYYDNLEKKYGILGEHLDILKEAAVETQKDPDLRVFLAILCEALKDRENISKELQGFAEPKAPEGKSKLAYSMICGLAIYSMVDYTYDLLKKRNIDDEMIKKVLDLYTTGIGAYMIRNNGEYGYRNFAWNQLFVDGYIFPIKRFNVEINKTLSVPAVIFRNKEGRTEAMANGTKLHKAGYPLGAKLYEDEEGSWVAELVETDEYYEGHIYRDNGFVDKEKTRLYKSDWEKYMDNTDPVVSLHISPGERMTPEIVDETLTETKKFLAKYYPDYKYKAFICRSWLCNHKLVDLLGENTNISRYTKRFRPLSAPTLGTGIFSFIFLKPDMNFEIKDLPENTTLERALKKYCLDGNVLHEMEGYFI